MPSKKNKFSSFLDSIKTYREKTTINCFKGGTEICSESEEVLFIDWTMPTWKQNELEFERYKFKIDLRTLKSIFKETYCLTPLTYDIWGKLENTDSYKVKSLEEAEKIAKTHGKDFESIIQEIEANKSSPAPIIIKWENNAYELISGNTRLMIANAIKIIPEVLILEVK